MRRSPAYAGTWLQSAGTLDVTTGDKVTFTGSGDAFSGTVAGAGSVVWSGGSDAFSGLTFSATSQTVTGAEVTLSGAINLTTNMSLTSTNLIVAAGGAILGGTGEFILSANASNSLYGADNAASLIVNGRFYGAGQLGAGQLTLIIGAGGFGTWQARIPEPDGETVTVRYTLRELLNRLAELTGG